MSRSLKAILIITIAFLVFAALILAKLYLSSAQKEKERGIAAEKIANIPLIEKSLKSDSLYEVRDVTYRDSAILIAVDNPEKSGTEAYFDRKYKLNGYDNINMVYVYKYDTAKPIQTVSFDDALMAKGKKLGKFQDQWVTRYIDSLDGSCMRRWAHCSPAFFAHSGASRKRPVWMSNAAPTPIMTFVSSW